MHKSSSKLKINWQEKTNSLKIGYCLSNPIPLCEAQWKNDVLPNQSANFSSRYIYIQFISLKYI